MHDSSSDSEHPPPDFPFPEDFLFCFPEDFLFCCCLLFCPFVGLLPKIHFQMYSFNFVKFQFIVKWMISFVIALVIEISQVLFYVGIIKYLSFSYVKCEINCSCIFMFFLLIKYNTGNIPLSLEEVDCPSLFAIFSSSPGFLGGNLPCGCFPGTIAPVARASSSTLEGINKHSK